MIEELLIAIVIILASIKLYKHATKNFDYWRKRKVVHPAPTPFFGNFGEVALQKINFAFVSNNIYNQFPKEKYVGALMGKNPVLVIRDPELIKLITTKDYYYFHGRGLGIIDSTEPLSQHLFLLSGDYWRVLRQNLTPLFSSAKMKNMFHLMAQCGRDFEDLIHRRFEESNELDIRDTMSRFSMDVIGSCAFGLQMNSLSGKDTEFRRVGFKLFNPTFSRTFKVLLRQLVPWLFNLLRLRIIDPKLNEFFLDLSRKVIQMREGRPPERHDFVDLLAELKRRGHIDGDSIESMKPGGERRVVSLEFNDRLIAAQSFVFFAAGFETSSTTMSYALYELAMNPDVQERAHLEMESLLIKYDGKITYEMLQEANYLEMVTNETLRKYPVLATITRECTSNYTLPGGLVVEQGVKIHLPVYALHHDPEHYPNPDVFNPERFTPDESRNRNQYTYMPFGEGQRLCIGMRFGKMQVLVGLISLLRNYSVEPCARTDKKITFEPKSNITMPKNKIYLKLSPRKK